MVCLQNRCNIKYTDVSNTDKSHERGGREIKQGYIFVFPPPHPIYFLNSLHRMKKHPDKWWNGERRVKSVELYIPLCLCVWEREVSGPYLNFREQYFCLLNQRSVITKRLIQLGNGLDIRTHRMSYPARQGRILVWYPAGYLMDWTPIKKRSDIRYRYKSPIIQA